MKTRPAPVEFGPGILVSFIIAGVLMVLGGGFGVVDTLQTDFPAIAQQTPVIRLSGGLGFVVHAFCLVIFGVLMAVTGFLLLINQPEIFITFRDAIAERTLYVVLPLSILVLVTQPIATRIIMPNYGYSICHGLQGDTRYSSDWVRNTAWCVRNKSLEWVRETATREAGSGAAPQAASGPPPVPAQTP